MLDERTRQRRARTWVYLAVTGLVLALLVAGLLNAALNPPTPIPGPAGSGSGVGEGPGPGPASGAAPSTGGEWDLAGEAALAATPMPGVAAAAASPQVIGTRSAGAAITIPAAISHGPLVEEGFPPTAEGAIGQLAALDTVELTDLNPQTYAAAYRSISLPGAPDPADTPLGSEVAQLYGRVSVAASDPVPIFSRWQLAGAQIKGSTDGGAYVVACVLGELQAAAHNNAAAGVGDCQALRYVTDLAAGSLVSGGQWRLAPGPAAAAAPDTWPGSDAFAEAGYRPIQTTAGSVPG